MVHVHKLFLVSCCPAWQALPVGRQGTGRIALEQRPLGLNKVRGLVKTRGPSAKSNAFSTQSALRAGVFCNVIFAHWAFQSVC